MPTYDYECDACGHSFELFQRITEDPIKKCPECKKNKVRRLFGTGAAIMFKGSGFYETDYRSDSYKKAAKEDKTKSETKPKSDSGKSDSAGKSKSKDSTAAKKSDKGSSKSTPKK